MAAQWPLVSELGAILALCLIFGAQLAANEVTGSECCDYWTREGWSRMKELPVTIVEHKKPRECSSNAVSPLSLNWRPRVARVRRADPGGGPQLLQPGGWTNVSWNPNGSHGDLGISLCSDPARSVCYMLDVFGVSPTGRLGYWWRRHSAEEPGVMSWVPGRTDHVAESILNTEGRLESCTWPDGGAKEVEVNLERTEASTMRVWMAGGDPMQAESMNFLLPGELPHFAVSPLEPLGQLNTATAAMSASQKAKLYSDAAINPLLMRGENLLQRPGNRVIVSWRPDDPEAKIGFALCQDRAQSVCFVLALYGVSGSRLCYVWARHGAAEPGMAGWVAGRPAGDRVPERLLRSNSAVTPGSWPQGTQMLRVDRSQPGAVRVEVQGGDPAQVAELTFPLPDAFSYFAVAASDSMGFALAEGAASPPPAPVAVVPPPAQHPPQQPAQHFQRPPTHRPQTQRPPTQRPPTQRPPTQRPPTQRPPTYRPPTQRPPTPPPHTQRPLQTHGHQTRPTPPPKTPPPTTAPPLGPLEPEESCSAAIRTTLSRGQQMLMVWQPKALMGNLGVSLCRSADQADCYVLDTYGFHMATRRVAYSWRHHGALEGGFGAWVPGRADLVPERHISLEQAVAPGWENSEATFFMMVSRTPSGTLVFRMDGLDPVQQQQLVFQLPDGYEHAAVASTQNQGEFSIRGPCYSGLRFKWNALLCHLPEAAALNIDYADLTASWTLKPHVQGAPAGAMRSPAMAGMDGQVCVSVVGLALGAAKMVIHVEDIEGSKRPIRLAEIAARDRSGPGEWQRVQRTVELPDSLRAGQVRVVVQAEGRGLALLHRLEFCNPNTCGVAPTSVIPLIAHGKDARRGDFPWYAGIYKRDGDVWDSICGGTLVRPDIVVSAAHCFYDESSLRLYDFAQFRVAVGKYKRDWTVREPDEQRSVVTNMMVPERYRGSKRIFEHDIAFLRVQFTITSLVLPICIDWTNVYPLRQGDVGVVAGWGTTEAYAPSTSLQYARMPFVPFDECIRSVPDTLARYITGDKFCAGNLNGSTVWPGDSGGGLTFLRAGLWYLNGVVSTGVPKRLTYSAYTDLKNYLDLLTGFIASS